MPAYVKGGHKVTVSGDEEIARFEAAGYVPVKASAPSTDSPKKAPAKKAAASDSSKK